MLFKPRSITDLVRGPKPKYQLRIREDVARCLKSSRCRAEFQKANPQAFVNLQEILRCLVEDHKKMDWLDFKEEGKLASLNFVNDQRLTMGILHLIGFRCNCCISTCRVVMLVLEEEMTVLAAHLASNVAKAKERSADKKRKAEDMSDSAELVTDSSAGVLTCKDVPLFTITNIPEGVWSSQRRLALFHRLEETFSFTSPLGSGIALEVNFDFTIISKNQQHIIDICATLFMQVNRNKKSRHMLSIHDDLSKKKRTAASTILNNVKEDLKPVVEMIQGKYPKHVFYKATVIISNKNGNEQNLHFDYGDDVGQKCSGDVSLLPFSVVIPLNVERKLLMVVPPDDTPVEITVPPQSHIIFPSFVEHAGGKNPLEVYAYSVHLYFATDACHIPNDEVHTRITE
jgi:hypothetical protein